MMGCIFLLFVINYTREIKDSFIISIILILFDVDVLKINLKIIYLTKIRENKI
jgi:hypothetical protein